MTPTCTIPVRTRVNAVVGSAVFLVLAGTAGANALWNASTTTTAPVAAGALSTQLLGTEGLTVKAINSEEYSTPTNIIIHNTSSITLDFTLALTTESGTLDPALVELVLWEAVEGTCPAKVPSTGTVVGTLADSPALPATATSGGPGTPTVLCAATRILPDRLFGTAEQSIAVTPKVTGNLAGTTWTIDGTGSTFTQAIAPAPNAVTNLTCTDRELLDPSGNVTGGDGIRLTWDAVEDADSGYEMRSGTGQILAETSDTSTALGTKADPGTSVQIVAVGTTGYSMVKSYPVHQDPDLGLRCETQ